MRFWTDKVEKCIFIDYILLEIHKISYTLKTVKIQTIHFLFLKRVVYL